MHDTLESAVAALLEYCCSEGLIEPDSVHIQPRLDPVMAFIRKLLKGTQSDEVRKYLQDWFMSLPSAVRIEFKRRVKDVSLLFLRR